MNASLILERPTILGKVDEDELLCQNRCYCRCCPTKRRCCVCFNLVLLVLDIIMLVAITNSFISIAAYYPYVMYVPATKHNDWVVKRFIVRCVLGYWAIWILLLLKLYFGLKWLCKRTRIKYMPYYRLTMTLCIVGLFD